MFNSMPGVYNHGLVYSLPLQSGGTGTRRCISTLIVVSFCV